MAKEIPTREPVQFTAGTTSKWKRVFVEFPVSESWVITYHLRGPSVLNITCSTDGDYFVASITAAQSALLTPGDYWLDATAAKAGEVYTVLENLSVKVLPALSAQVAGYDGRSDAKKILDAINALISGKATQDQLTSKIGDIEIGRMTPDQIERWRNIYKTEVANEARAERLRNGLPNRRIIGMRFGTP